MTSKASHTTRAERLAALVVAAGEGAIVIRNVDLH
jgi:hypothetical protein